MDSSSDYSLNIDLKKIVAKEDNRTTLMIKNIPNKYDVRMMTKQIDANHKGRYDFFYLPIDYKNHCNVGYGFINFIHPVYILDFFYDFNGQGWPSYKSDKICEL